MAIIDYTYFIADINLPTDSTALQNKLTTYIEQAQRKYLLKGLGYELYKLFIAELPTPTSQRFTDLLNGKEYTSTLTGKLNKWTGLANTDLESFLAYFAAYLYSYYSQAQESGTGMLTSLHENGEKISPVEFQVNAYNKGIKHYFEMLEFLKSNYDIYPELDYTEIKSINWAGI